MNIHLKRKITAIIVSPIFGTMALVLFFIIMFIIDNYREQEFDASGISPSTYPFVISFISLAGLALQIVLLEPIFYLLERKGILNVNSLIIIVISLTILLPLIVILFGRLSSENAFGVLWIDLIWSIFIITHVITYYKIYIFHFNKS